MKKGLKVVILLVVCALFTACTSNLPVNADVGNAPSPAPAAPTATAAATDIPSASAAPAGTSAEVYGAYQAALENMIQNHVFPDGSDVQIMDSEDITQNQFAIYDVDNDGQVELLLMYTNTAMAGQAGYVFSYDDQTEKIQSQLLEFPSFTFYDNGVVKAGWSHNQGFGGDFWPYSLYQYQPDSDSYQFVGMVDAWDKKVTQRDGEANPFPEDIDQSGTGFVYYIMEDERYDNTHPVDASVYEAWIGSYIADATEIQIRYMDLTQENIAQIGEEL